MKVLTEPERSSWGAIIRRPAVRKASLEASVVEILNDVREAGDQALTKYSRFYDKTDIESFQVTEAEILSALDQIPSELKSAIRQAKANIEAFHTRQIEEPVRIETMPGVRCWRKNVAISPVGLYVPAGSAPLFSTVLMLGVPARIAGCTEIVMCTPPDTRGRIHPAILFTANLLEISQIFKIGGAHAIAAMAYGTETVPGVNKIFGPGNQYVTAAKQLVSREGTAIDLPAGPSELVVYADESCDPGFVAADLLSQAEHGADSQVMLVSASEKIVRDVNLELDRQLESLPRRAMAEKSLGNGFCLILKDQDDVMDFINTYAPEHLILACADAEMLADKVVNAGSVFLGNFAPESAGDYASGTNHVLPTGGYARSYSGVSVDSFVKKITFQNISKDGLRGLASAVQGMAEAEDLVGHSRAVGIRLEGNNRGD